MIYIKETYTSGGLTQKEIYYFDALREFVVDFTDYENEELKHMDEYDFKTTTNGYELYRNNRLLYKGYLVEKE